LERYPKIGFLLLRPAGISGSQQRCASGMRLRSKQPPTALRAWAKLTANHSNLGLGVRERRCLFIDLKQVPPASLHENVDLGYLNAYLRRLLESVW